MSKLHIDRFFVAVHKFLNLPKDYSRDLEVENMYKALSHMSEDEKESATIWAYDFLDRMRSMPDWESGADVKEELRLMMKHKLGMLVPDSLHSEDVVPVGAIECFLLERTNWAKLVQIHHRLQEAIEAVGSMQFINRTCPVCGAVFSDGCKEDEKEGYTIEVLAKGLKDDS
jgi:hypothetical protein